MDQITWKDLEKESPPAGSTVDLYYEDIDMVFFINGITQEEIEEISTCGIKIHWRHVVLPNVKKKEE